MESKEGNGTVTWADAHLTPQGIDEASQNGAYWAQQLAIEGGVPAPNSYYVSPLFRCLQTANLTFGGLNLPSGAAPFVPTTKENVREVFGYATATRRSSKTVITNNFPSYKIEQGFTENDELWKPNVWNVELPWNTDKRVKFFLDELFTGGDTQGARTENMIVSVTSHAGTTDSFLRVIGHRSFPLGTAGVVPVFVKASGL